MSIDDWTPRHAGIESPPVHGESWTPSDTEELPFMCRGFTLAAEGALHVTWESGEEEIIPTGHYAVGVTHPARFRKIWATGTGPAMVRILR